MRSPKKKAGFSSLMPASVANTASVISTRRVLMSTFESLSSRACDWSAVTGTVLCSTKVKSRSAPPTCPKWRVLASEVVGCGAAKRKGHLVRYFIKSKEKMPSVHNQDAEERLDARIIKSASRLANPRPNAEEILDAGIIKSAFRPANPRPNAGEILDAGIRVQTCKIRVLPTKTYEIQVLGLRRQTARTST